MITNTLNANNNSFSSHIPLIQPNNSFLPIANPYKPLNPPVFPTNIVGNTQNNSFMPINANPMVNNPNNNVSMNSPPMASSTYRPFNAPFGGSQGVGNTSLAAPFQNNNQPTFNNPFGGVSNQIQPMNNPQFNSLSQGTGSSMFNAPGFGTNTHSNINNSLQNPFTAGVNNRGISGMSMLTAVEPTRQSYKPPGSRR
jgi:hypothetical protein